MTDINVNSIGGNIESGGAGRANALNDEKGGAFDAVINDAMTSVSEVQNNVDMAVKELASGGDITSAVLAVEKADMTFQLMVEIRNKLLRSYEEIMRMQV